MRKWMSLAIVFCLIFLQPTIAASVAAHTNVSTLAASAERLSLLDTGQLSAPEADRAVQLSAPEADRAVPPAAAQDRSASNGTAPSLDYGREYTPEELAEIPAVNGFDYEFAEPSREWQYVVAGEAAAKFTQVDYELAEGVLDLSGNDKVFRSIASEGQVLAGSPVQKLRPASIIASGGFIPTNVLDEVAAQVGRTVENGTVVVDRDARAAFKVVSETAYTGVYQANQALQNLIAPLKDMYSITQPRLEEIFQDFSLGGTAGEDVVLTRGNISGFAKNIEKNVVLGEPVTGKALSLEDRYDGYRDIYGDLLVNLRFDEELLDAQLSNGAYVRVKVSGGIGIQRIQINARYTAFKGYRFDATLNQESFLHVEMEAALDEEIRIPVFGVDVGIGDVGRVTGGVFILVKIDGSLRLEIAAREFTSTTAGIRGGTVAYVPTSVRPVFSKRIKGDGDVNLSGEVDGYIKFGPMLGIELFGHDLVGAGAFLGTGVEVDADQQDLNIELYGILNVYVNCLGKHFNPLNLRPTLWEKKQTNTAGHRITFMEAYVYPGRVSGLIQKEVPISAAYPEGFASVPNLPYRVWVAPEGRSFDPNNTADRNSPDFRKYPASGYAKTNAEGVFFQADENMLLGGDRAYVEFQVGGQSYFSVPAEASLPFNKYTVTQGDYFNDFVVGQVQPVRVINWNAPANDPEKRYETYYYANSTLYVRPMLYVKQYGSDTWLTNGGVAYARTDEYGNFDTRDPYVNDQGEAVPPWNFDLRPDPQKWLSFDSFRFYIALDHRGATISGEVPFTSTIDMAFSRTVREVPDSYKRFEISGGRLMDQMAYDEYIYVANPNGTLAVSEEEFCYWAAPFSTQDFHEGLVDYRYMPVSIAENLWRDGAPDVNTPQKKLLPIPDANGDPSGATLFLQRVFVEWVWQAHPNPVKITSPDKYSAPASGGTFQVTAKGYAPFTYSLLNAPEGVTIDPDSGVMTIAGDSNPPAVYSFTVRAEENRKAYQVTLPGGSVLDSSKLLGPYEGNDPSPPDEQAFTLTLIEPLAPPPTPVPSETTSETTATATTAPTTTAKPTPTPTTTKPPTTSTTTTKPTSPPTTTSKPTPTPTTTLATRTPPNINAPADGFHFNMTVGGPLLSTQVTASGSTPITWSLEPVYRQAFPDSANIDPRTGLLTIGSDLAAGQYSFTILAANDVGQDGETCTLEVRSAPVIETEDHNYLFKITKKSVDVTIPIYATGSRPITWSLEFSGNLPIASALSIHPDTGVLTIAPTITTGVHYFTIRARNDVGSDTQDCRLEVILIPFSLQYHDQPDTSPGQSTAILLSSLPGGGSPAPAYLPADDRSPADPAIYQLMPPNTVTLRYDDPNDVYTNDRWTKNGATFVRWQAAVGVLQRFNHMNDEFWDGGTGTLLLDSSPRVDNYHYYGTASTPPTTAEVQEYFKERISEYQKQQIVPIDIFGQDTLLETYFSDRAATSASSYFNYGVVIDRMQQAPEAEQEVTLSERTGTLVSGKVFAALQNFDAARLTIRHEGAAVSFLGRDILRTADHALYDFAYRPGALHEADIAEQLEAKDQHFICSFAEQPSFPGPATFSVKTDLAPGAEVNVYRYETAEQPFSLLAKALTVDENGIVTYRNDTTSALLITTQTIKGAAVSDLVSQQSAAVEEEPSGGWMMAAAAAALVAAGAAGSVVGWKLLKKKRSS